MRIIHPRPQAGHQSDFQVDFTDGVATVESLHPERELALLQHGFTIEADLDVEVPHHGALGDEIIDLNSLTKAELREIANQEGIEIPAKATRPEMVEILSRQPATPIPGAVQSEAGSYTMVGEPVTEGQAEDGPFAIVELPDGTVIGDGTSIATLPAGED